MIKDKIKKLRLDMKLTQRELAEKINVSPNTITNYESGYRTPEFETLVKMADIFDVSTDYLLGRTESKISTTHEKGNDNEYYKYLEKEYWDLITKLNVVEIKVLKSIVDSGFSLLDINNALKELLEKKERNP